MGHSRTSKSCANPSIISQRLRSYACLAFLTYASQQNAQHQLTCLQQQSELCIRACSTKSQPPCRPDFSIIDGNQSRYEAHWIAKR